MYRINLKAHHVLQGWEIEDIMGSATWSSIVGDTMHMAMVSRFSPRGLGRYVLSTTSIKFGSTPEAHFQPLLWRTTKHWRLEKAIEAAYAAAYELAEL